ncbi:hypothetical protein CPI04_06020 [Moraxella catarrhalis]|nr:hypothetical protein [Moraxella catarrhalis]
MLLPESVLLGLFPQGLVLSKPASWEGGDDGVFAVDVSCTFSAGFDAAGPTCARPWGGCCSAVLGVCGDSTPRAARTAQGDEADR